MSWLCFVGVRVWLGDALASLLLFPRPFPLPRWEDEGENCTANAASGAGAAAGTVGVGAGAAGVLPHPSKVRSSPSNLDVRVARVLSLGGT